MKHYRNKDRTESLKRLIPELFTYSCLYIGARPDRMDYLEDFETVQIVEVYRPNVTYLKKVGYQVTHRDIHTWLQDPRFKDKIYEVVFWWHGPEHIPVQDLSWVIKNLEKHAKKAVVLGCPWGDVEQGEIYGNPNEKHLCFLDYDYFEQMGYETECLGIKGKLGSNITAVKYV